MINWQVVGQLLALTFIILSGPAVVSILAFKKADAL
jgi:hypothetical protein